MILKSFSKLEKAALIFLFSTLIFSFAGILRQFWIENTAITPSNGGEFLEGAVGKIDENFLINPLFTFGKKGNSTEADLTNLIFAGLMRFNASKGKHEDFLADHILSQDKKTYTFRLKENLTWHDGVPITANDVIFTFQTVIQNPEFSNKFLHASFEEVDISKIDGRTISFKISRPYKFFLTNFTVGLLPRHLLEQTPIKNLHLDSFNQAPVGCGPFKFNHISTENNEFDEIRLSKFNDFIFEKPKIEFINFRIFHNKNDLIANLNELDSIRPILKREADLLPISEKFEKRIFHLPQYVSVFINMENPLFESDTGQKMRWALQLATNKTDILSQVNGKRIDTPLLEIDAQNWLTEFNLKKASGALKDSGWFLPEKLYSQNEIGLEEILEETEHKWIFEPTSKEIFETKKTDFFILGRFPENTKNVFVNDYKLNLFDPEKGRWSFFASYDIGTLQYGENDFKIEFFDHKNQLLGQDNIKVIFKKEEEEITEIKDSITDNIFNEQDFTSNKQENKEEIVMPKEIPLRVSESGVELNISLITASTPEYFPLVAEILKKQWRQVGIDLKIEILDRQEILQRIEKRNYDLLLFGQNLGYNPDAFGYWHLSQAHNGLNLSNYQSFEASVILEEIRRSHNEILRLENLEKLQRIISKDVPAIFLFSPDYVLIIEDRVKNISFHKLALFPDRFSNIEDWYIYVKRDFKENTNWWSFFKWFGKKIFNF